MSRLFVEPTVKATALRLQVHSLEIAQSVQISIRQACPDFADISTSIECTTSPGLHAAWPVVSLFAVFRVFMLFLSIDSHLEGARTHMI